MCQFSVVGINIEYYYTIDHLKFPHYGFIEVCFSMNRLAQPELASADMRAWKLHDKSNDFTDIGKLGIHLPAFVHCITRRNI